MISLPPPATFFPRSKAEEIVAACNADDHEWTYKVVETLNSKGLVKIVVCDETGAEVGTL